MMYQRPQMGMRPMMPQGPMGSQNLQEKMAANMNVPRGTPGVTPLSGQSTPVGPAMPGGSGAFIPPPIQEGGMLPPGGSMGIPFDPNQGMQMGALSMSVPFDPNQGMLYQMPLNQRPGMAPLQQAQAMSLRKF